MSREKVEEPSSEVPPSPQKSYSQIGRALGASPTRRAQGVSPPLSIPGAEPQKTHGDGELKYHLAQEEKEQALKVDEALEAARKLRAAVVARATQRIPLGNKRVSATGDERETTYDESADDGLQFRMDPPL